MTGWIIGGMVIRRKWLVLPCIGIALAVGYALYSVSPPVYKSDATVVVEDNNRNVGVEGVEATDDDGADMETQIVLIKSPRIVGRAVKENGLADLESLSGLANPVQFIIDRLDLFHHTGNQRRLVHQL